MAEQIARLPYQITEFCLGTAEAVLPNATVMPYRPRAREISPSLRPAVRYSDLAELLLAWTLLSRMIERSSADVILAHPCQFFQAPPALLSRRKPSIYFCHEPRRVDYEAAASESRRSRTRLLYGPIYATERALDRAAVRRSGALLANSRYTAAAMLNAYGRGAEVARLGVPDLFLDTTDDAPIEHVLSVGALIPSKGHDLAIQAMAAADIAMPLLIVAARDAPDEANRLRTLARRFGVTLDIRLGITDEELRTAYTQALATLYLARNEPYGLVSIEAQACGCPVIVSNEGGLPETLLEGVTGWAVSRQPETVSTNLRRLLDTSVRTSMGDAATRHGRGFDWRSAIAELEVEIERTATNSKA
jgi:glycosyltransferase involved in cell wall biosynthesis